jgi:hypothetical protein
MTTQKLEWVTPKISLMDAEDTEGTGKNVKRVDEFTVPYSQIIGIYYRKQGPS